MVDRVTVTLTWSELGLIRGVLNLKIEEFERRLAIGLIADPDDFLGAMKRAKVKLDRPVERLKARAGR